MEYLSTNKIHLGRSENKMMEVEPGSIALSFWSPPYFVGKDYEKNETYESWQIMLKKVIKNHHIVLKQGGFLVINIADILCFKDENMPRIQVQNTSMQKCAVTKEMALEAKEKHPDYNRNQLANLLGCSEQTIDRRLHGVNIRGGKYQTQTRVQLAGGSLEKYAYDAGLYLYDVRIWAKDPAWVNSKWTSNTLKAVHEFEYLYVFWKAGECTIDKRNLTASEWKEWGSRGIWYINSVSRNDNHEAKFPFELASKVIRLYSYPGDTVLDPFMGSGTTALAAIDLDRKFIGIEKEEKYIEIANKALKFGSKQLSLFT
jgi:DNA modification methylase